MLDYEHARNRMVEWQVAGRGINDPRVLAAMREVPREDFVEPGYEEFAYEDSPLPITQGQTISQPYIVALMIEAAQIDAGDRVLEIGTGSGYATAIMARLAKQVFSIERRKALGQLAQRRLDAIGTTNVKVRIGDGSTGWPEEAPFGAILVAAGAPDVPKDLKRQLAIGGRLVIPVGAAETEQRLIRVTRVTDQDFEEEDLGGVRFVPLIGERGWAPEPAAQATLPQLIAATAEDLPDLDDREFGAAFDRFADRRVVLLGEASHGTSEFYRARAAITRRLVERHGFTTIAVEADWPDAAAVNRYVRRHPQSASAAAPFQRFPVWMWRNREVAVFLDWLRQYNQGASMSDQAGFFGLDIYNMGASIAAVIDYLDTVDPDAAAVARERYGCLTPWQSDPATYGRAVLTAGYRDCEEQAIRQCRDMLARQLAAADEDGAGLLDAVQSARLVANAEQYYRVMYYGGAESWNLRDRHMFDTLGALLDHAGESGKAVVWAHNSHIGDARQTEMGQKRGELNLGQLCRERWGDHVALIGFGTHAGTVAAATDWDGEMEIKSLRPSIEDSVEHCFHKAGKPRSLLDFSSNAELAARLARPRLERFIGVIYRPETERLSHYAQAALSQQFDAYVWFDQTSAVQRLPIDTGPSGPPDTFPFGI